MTKRKIILLVACIFIVVVATIGLFIFLLFKDVPNPQKLTKSPAPVSTQIFDRNSKLLYEVYVDQNRLPVNINDVPDYLKKATVSIEDKNFYKHHGLDTRGILRAAFKLATGGRLEGGSTITQQLVKVAILSDNRRTVTRKIREAGLAIFTEILYSKDQILELYLNHAPYGGTAYGIEAASKVFFGKTSKDLNLAESALLAGLPQSPTKYSPFGANPELAINRQHLVLDQMAQDGYITKEQAEEAKNLPLHFANNTKSIKAPHFSLMVRDLLVDRYGEDRVNLGGLKVTTTLDLDLQEYAQATVSSEINKVKKYKISNGASLITRPKTGEILAMVGSKDYFSSDIDGNVNLTTRLRQPGSSIKPINYAVGLLRGWTASTVYLDIPTCFSVTNQKQYCPKNYDNSFHGPVQMRFALGNSYNIPAVKQLALNGIDSFIATASAMGITTWTDPSRYGLSLTLGGGEVTMSDMSTAFGTFANAGVTVPLNPILKVETYNGEVLEENRPNDLADVVNTLPQEWSDFWQKRSEIASDISYQCTQYNHQCLRVSLPEGVAYIISHILLDNNARTGAFGPNSQLLIPNKSVSVKTGTTNDLRDNWTIGFTPDILVATWVGNNDNTPMSYVASGVTGASSIWQALMRRALKQQPDHFPKQPNDVESKVICANTGLVPNDPNSCPTRTELFIKGVYPPNQIPERKQIWVRRSDKYPLLPGDTTVDLDLEEHTIINDPFTHDFCLDCTYPVNDKGTTQWPTYNINYDTFRMSPPSPRDYLVLGTPTPQP